MIGYPFFSNTFLNLFYCLSDQRKEGAKKAREAKGSGTKGAPKKESVLERIERCYDIDKMEADEDSVFPGNFQLMEIGECLFGFYNLPAILHYLIFNQESPLMIDATGLRIRQWRNKKHWYGNLVSIV